MKPSLKFVSVVKQILLDKLYLTFTLKFYEIKFFEKVIQINPTMQW